MIELISKSKGKFKPHIAVCHMSPEINGGSANEENTALILKAQADGVKLNTILKALGEDSHILEKATYRNLNRQLDVAVSERLKLNNPDSEYIYCWIVDFDESTVVFEHGDVHYSMSYVLSENDIVSLVGEYTEVVRHEIYTNVEGDSLVLKGAEEVSDSLEATNEEDGEVSLEASEDNEDNKETTVSKDIEQTQDVEAIVEKALATAKATWEADLAQKELIKSTNAIVKGFSFIGEDAIPAIVKALTSVDGADIIVKAFEDAEAKIVLAEAEVVKAKEEFGNKEQVADESVPSTDKLSAAQQLKANMAKVKAAKLEASK